MQATSRSNISGKPDRAASSEQPARQPVDTVSSTLARAARALCREETSGMDLSALQASLGRAKNFAFGEKIAHGMVVTFSSGTPQIHISDTEIKPILQSLREYGHKLSECVEKYQQLLGRTPSKEGLRVFSLVLKKIIADDNVNRELKTICNEALDINLITPNDPQWRREVVVPINGTNTKITLSLKPISLFSQAVLRNLNTDVPVSNRNNRYWYELKITPEVPKESVALTTLKTLARQAVAVTALMAPMAITAAAVWQVSLTDIMANLGASPLVQDVLGKTTEFLAIAASGVLSFAANRLIARRRLKQDN